jgi:hypothetical protein
MFKIKGTYQLVDKAVPVPVYDAGPVGFSCTVPLNRAFRTILSRSWKHTCDSLSGQLVHLGAGGHHPHTQVIHNLHNYTINVAAPDPSPGSHNWPRYRRMWKFFKLLSKVMGSFEIFLRHDYPAFAQDTRQQRHRNFILLHNQLDSVWIDMFHLSWTEILISLTITSTFSTGSK